MAVAAPTPLAASSAKSVKALIPIESFERERNSAMVEMGAKNSAASVAPAAAV